MKRGGKIDILVSMSRLRSIQFLMGFLFLYLLLMSFEIPLVFKSGFGSDSTGGGATVSILPQPTRTEGEDDHPPNTQVSHRVMREYKNVSGLVFDDTVFDSISKDEFSELHMSARDAFVLGKKVWEEIRTGSGKLPPEQRNESVNRTESPPCPVSLSVLGPEFLKSGGVMVIPCGLTLGSHITIVGKPKWAHPEHETKIALLKEDQSVMVSQFMMELQGLKVVDGEEPPRILHFNPRLKGDWSGRPVIEQNTCYRMQWGSAMRCEGWKSRADEETVDGQVKCEKWNRDDDNGSEESNAVWWLSTLIGRTKKVTVNWPYPFAEGKLFVLTLSAGLEGYHVNVDGRHITSFPYRPGFTLEDATGLSLQGDVEVQSIFGASLPASNPNFAPMGHLEMVSKWRAPPLPDGPLEIFVGVLSAGNHFAERMAARKSWMQHRLIRSGSVVARFFVALHGRKEVNLQLMEETEYFGDIVMVPYMDNYDLVVLKTVAICEYGVRTAAAKYIMKCDDDTFVRVDAVMIEVKKVPHTRSLYVGNINYFHKPLRNGKWAVTYEEWPEEYYPPYANGPGYVVSSDIAQYTVSEFERHKLRLFKMEDVSMGMWVENFNRTRPVLYIHSLKFCQFGCIEDYLTAHYQSPRQMICLWGKLQQGGKARCCDTR